MIRFRPDGGVQTLDRDRRTDGHAAPRLIAHLSLRILLTGSGRIFKSVTDGRKDLA